MIKNEFQYQVTQDWVKRFKGAIAAADRDEERKKNGRERWQINRDVLPKKDESLKATSF